MNLLKTYTKLCKASCQNLTASATYSRSLNIPSAIYRPIAANFASNQNQGGNRPKVEKPDFDKIYDKTSNQVPPQESDSGFSSKGTNANSNNQSGQDSQATQGASGSAAGQAQGSGAQAGSGAKRANTVEKPDFDKIYDKNAGSVQTDESQSGFSSKGTNQQGNKN